MKRTTRIILAVFLAIGTAFAAGVSGFFIGNVISFRMKRKTNYNFDVLAYTETIEDIDYKATDSPATKTGSDAFIIASHLLDQREYYKIHGDGLVNTGFGKLGTLKLWGNALKENNQIHTSIVAWTKLISKYQVGLKYDYDLEKDLINFYYGKSHSDGSVTWGKPEYITSSEYIKEWGLAPTNFFTYTISSKTTLVNEGPSVIYEGGKKLYRFSLSLSPVYAVSNYAKQLKKMSGGAGYPAFSFCYFTFDVDEDFTLRGVSIHENYSVYLYGVNVKCDANIKYTFEY